MGISPHSSLIRRVISPASIATTVAATGPIPHLIHPFGADFPHLPTDLGPKFAMGFSDPVLLQPELLADFSLFDL
jgi:hypothetical protein